MVKIASILNSMMALWFAFLLVLVPNAEAEVCATNAREAQPLAPLFEGRERVGLVNETKGSYVVLSEREGKLHIDFYTSGLFDLYGIHKDGPFAFCTTENGYEIDGLGRRDRVRIEEGKFILGDGGPKRVFRAGPPPDLLVRLHGLKGRDFASKP